MAISTPTTYAIDVKDVEYLRHGDKPLLARHCTAVRGVGGIV
jgi:hypothetical protein